MSLKKTGQVLPETQEAEKGSKETFTIGYFMLYSDSDRDGTAI